MISAMAGAPHRVGPYEMVREIGRGGMGVVFLARDDRLDRDVAIKALPEEMASDPARLERFEREAKSLAALNHPNIAGIHGVEEQDEQKYLILEYVEGETLGERLDRGPVPIDEAIEIAMEMAAGIEAAHEAGIVHRDLKPDNIKLTPEGEVKVLDFGLARPGEGASSATGTDVTLSTPRSPTMPGAILGTAAYMSPEQARGRRVDKRADTWAFGVILYEMLTGVCPFAGETATDSLGATMHREPDWSLLPSGTPAGVVLLLRQCLTKDRKHRLHDIADARVALEFALAEPPSTITGGGRSNRAKAIIVCAFVFLSGLVVTLGWFAMRWGERSVEPLPVAFEIDVSELGVLSLPESTADIAISPDGQLVAFEYLASIGDYRIGVRSLGSNKIRSIEDGGGPFFSPDGRQIAFQRGPRLAKVEIDGPVEFICDLDGGINGRAVWLPSNEIVYSDGDRLLAVDAGGGQPRVVAESDRDTQHEDRSQTVRGFEHVCAIPGGRGVLCGTWSGPSVEDYDIVHVDLRTGKVTHVIERATQPMVLGDDIVVFLRGSFLYAVRFDFGALRAIGQPRLVFDGVRTDMWSAVAQFEVHPDGTLAYVPGRRVIEDRRLIRVSRTREIEILSEPESLAGYLDVSHDGQHVALVVHRRQEQVWLFDMEHRSMARISHARSAASEPMLSPDGTQIVYMVYDEQDGATLMIESLELDEPARELIADARRMQPRAWSADGRYILLTKGGGATPLVLDLESDEGAQEIGRFTSGHGVISLSPNGEWIAFRARRGAEANINVCRFPYDNRSWRVSFNGGYRPAWSTDGDEIFFIEGSAVMAASFSIGEDGEPVIGAAELVFDATDLFSLADGVVYDVTPDGDFIMIAPAAPETDARLNVVLNWGDTVRQRMGVGAEAD